MVKVFCVRVRAPISEKSSKPEYYYYSYSELTFPWDPDSRSLIQLSKVFKTEKAAVKYAKKYAKPDAEFCGVFDWYSIDCPLRV